MAGTESEALEEIRGVSNDLKAIELAVKSGNISSVAVKLREAGNRLIKAYRDLRATFEVNDNGVK